MSQHAAMSQQWFLPTSASSHAALRSSPPQQWPLTARNMLPAPCSSENPSSSFLLLFSVALCQPFIISVFKLVLRDNPSFFTWNHKENPDKMQARLLGWRTETASASAWLSLPTSLFLLSSPFGLSVEVPWNTVSRLEASTFREGFLFVCV